MLRSGDIVAFPTETVYGLGGDARSDEAISKIFKAKGRPSDNPLIVHAHSKEAACCVVGHVPKMAEMLMDAFWPGPLTIVMPVKEGAVSRLCTAGKDTVAVRVPDNDVALELLKAAGIPIAAPSANSSGRPSPTTAAHVLDDLSGKIAGVVDGGATGVGLESTVVECVEGKDEAEDRVVILRPGGVTKKQLEAVVGPCVEYDVAVGGNDDKEFKPRAPGMKYRHYAPLAPMCLVIGGVKDVVRHAEAKKAESKRVGVLVCDEWYDTVDQSGSTTRLIKCGSINDLAEVAHNLYACLRAFDSDDEVDIILCQSFSTDGIGLALMNRLTKASGGKIV